MKKCPSPLHYCLQHDVLEQHAGAAIAQAVLVQTAREQQKLRKALPQMEQ